MLIFGANGVNLKTLYGWRVCIYCINWLEDSGNMRGFHDNTGLVTSNFKDEEQIYNPCSLFDSLRSRCSWRRREALRRQVWSRHSLDWQLLIIWASETPAHADTVNVHVVTLTHWVCVCVCFRFIRERRDRICCDSSGAEGLPPHHRSASLLWWVLDRTSPFTSTS